ncbi:ATP-binding protein [Polaromonas sp. UC242_47]|uniref:sensor histidine kinase n=1 Tax=Polaromonas sp. UC242_47 TaxID=3374626 RepID=UPI0037896CFB
MTSGLQRRLLLLLFLPLTLVALISIYVDYRAAGNAALQQDQRLLHLIPLLADSVVAPGHTPGGSPVLLLAPPLEEFIKAGHAGFRISDVAGGFLAGEAWITAVVPPTREPEFHSVEEKGVTYRIAAQRVKTAAGELILQLADGSDARQQWVRSVVFKVLLPNLLLMLAAGLAINWAVSRAFKPLLLLKDAVEHRSPRDLSAIDPQSTPSEVQPLVASLNRLFALVNDQAESQRRFVADAAHQLRTPLAGLQAQVEAWAQAAGAPAAGGQLTLSADKILALRSATRRTSQLANQLLALSRVDASNRAGQPLQRVDIKDLCEAVLALHLDAAAAKGIDLGLDAAFAQVSGYAWLLRELLGNLVDNAVKYTPPGGTVTIRCGRLGDQVLLEVEDNGPGIPADALPRVLERFYRVPGTAGEGNGLGLAIADEIARLHRSQLVLAPADLNPAEGARSGLRVRLVMDACR